MIFCVDRRILRKVLKKLSYFFTSSSGEWANSISLTVKTDGNIAAIDFYTSTSTESFQTLCPIFELSRFSDEEIVVDGLMLSNIVNKATGENVIFSVNFEDGTLKLESDETEWNLPFLIKSLKRQKCTADKILVNSSILRDSLKLVKSSIGFDSGRPYLMMANVSKGKVQACDGFKLQETRIDNKELDMEIPAPSILPLLKLMDNDWSSEQLQIQTDESITCVRHDTDKFCFAQPKAKFPDLSSMVVTPLKSKVPFVLTLNTKEIISRIEQVMVMSDKKSPTITFELDGPKLTLSCSSSSTIAAKTDLSVNWTGPRKIMHFDIKSLLELLRSSNEEELEVRISRDKKDENGPIVMESDEVWSMLNQVKVLK
jgi:DNA polymerase III sliding clamp (beta) subunit (PCNA family)